MNEGVYVKAKQFLVIGAGRFGSALATTLYQMGHEVVVIDQNEHMIEEIMHQVTHAVIADATEEDTLRKLGCSNFDTVVVSIGDDLEANILTTVAAKSVGAKHVISKAKNNTAARILSRVGADMVIRPEHDMGIRLAEQLSSPTVLDELDLGYDHAVVEIEVGKNMVGTLSDLRLPSRFGVQVITVNRSGEITVSPQADFALQEGDTILVIGHDRSIQKLRNFLGN